MVENLTELLRAIVYRWREQAEHWQCKFTLAMHAHWTWETKRNADSGIKKKKATLIAFSTM